MGALGATDLGDVPSLQDQGEAEHVTLGRAQSWIGWWHEGEAFSGELGAYLARCGIIPVSWIAKFHRPPRHEEGKAGAISLFTGPQGPEKLCDLFKATQHCKWPGCSQKPDV